MTSTRLQPKPKSLDPSAGSFRNPGDAETADRASQALTSALADVAEAHLTLKGVSGRRRSILIPIRTLLPFLEILRKTAQGKPEAIAPEVTTQEAADLLNVSRPYLVGLLEKGVMPYRKVGVQRRIQLQDLMQYKERFDADRRTALDELARQAQDLRLGYDG